MTPELQACCARWRDAAPLNDVWLEDRVAFAYRGNGYTKADGDRLVAAVFTLRAENERLRADVIRLEAALGHAALAASEAEARVAWLEDDMRRRGR